MFRVTRYPMISKTESGRVGYRRKYRVAGRVRVPAGHCSHTQKYAPTEQGEITGFKSSLTLIESTNTEPPLSRVCFSCTVGVPPLGLLLLLEFSLHNNHRSKRDGWRCQNGRIFEKVPKRGKGSFSIQNIAKGITDPGVDCFNQ